MINTQIVDLHVRQRLTDTPVEEQPFPHFFVENVFPAAYYQQMLENWPKAESLRSIANSGRVDSGSYRERHFLSLTEPSTSCSDFWATFSAWITGESFTRFLLDRYSHWIRQYRQLPTSIAISADAMIVQDHENYNIGPHTDAPHRLISTLFYCPPDFSQREMGTSLYIPKPCSSIPLEILPTHYSYEYFSRIGTAPFIPNSLFGFIVTPNSFHGVEDHAMKGKNVRRNAILHFVRWKNNKDWSEI